MLSRLSIQNYAIIDRLEVDFSSQLNIITGETGAGKSIIIGALGLILGQRSEGGVLYNKERKCIVEGCFRGETADEQVLAFLKEHELDVHDELVVRREIATNGKSRAFINDTPVNLGQLNQLSSLLVDLHQQFDTLELGETDFQRQVMDALAANFPLVKKYNAVFVQLQAARKQLEELKEQKAQFEKESDYHQFQYNELEEAGFKENELEDLEQELKMLSNAEGIKNALAKAYFELEESEEPIIRQLKTVTNQLQVFSELHPDLPGLLQRLQSAYLELQDIADETDRINNHIGSDAATLEQINERMSLGYRLLKKHAVKTTNELIAIRKDLEQKLQAVLNIDDAIAAGEKHYAQLLQDAEEKAGKISAARKAQVKPMEQQI
ncbi:MAG TPA: AAA family ATPase, partial [Flavisolibacter sp.]|nr:AAA family ATPase [Flavisolibacter sp.]